jgi:hypothetical protein
MRHVLHSLEYPNKDLRVAIAPDRLIVGSAQHIHESGEHCLDSSPLETTGKD